jgi:hypothetical protein
VGGLIAGGGLGGSGTGTPDRPATGLGSWRVRRAFMFCVTLFCAACISFVLGAGSDSRVAETTVEMAFTTMAAVTAAYVFGAVWNDTSMHRTRHETRRYRYSHDSRVDNPEDFD